MDVAILYSGGKDSTFAIDDAKSKGWNIKYLLSVKPVRTDCYLFHFATVEHTPVLAKALNIPHTLLRCDVADPKKEAELIRHHVLAAEKIDALVLGGTGLQETQIRSLQEAMLPSGIEVFAAHSGQDHDVVMEQMIEKGYDIRITQIASDGLDRSWLGRKIDKATLEEMKIRADQFGFHVGGEGGYFDTFVVDGPIFSHRIEIVKADAVMESANTGHLVIKELAVVDKKVKLNL